MPAPRRALLLAWSMACSLASLLAGAPLLAQSFGDADLRQLLAQGGNGLIYVWSPHMPYSIKGASEARRAGKALGLTTVVLLDPNAEPALAEHTQRTHGLPHTALVRLRSPILQARGLTQHFPSALVYRDGALDTQLLPGYAPREDLAGFVLRRLRQ